MGRAPSGRAIRCKSSALPTVVPAGFPLLSLAHSNEKVPGILDFLIEA